MDPEPRCIAGFGVFGLAEPLPPRWTSALARHGSKRNRVGAAASPPVTGPHEWLNVIAGRNWTA